MWCCDPASNLHSLLSASCKDTKFSKFSAVEEFKKLEESLRGWASCSRAIRRALLPEAAVEHSRKVLEADSRVRSWQPDQHSGWGLLYRCSQAQVEFANPAGGAYPNGNVCLFGAALQIKCAACTRYP